MVVGEGYDLHWPQSWDWAITAAGAIASTNARVCIIVDFHVRLRYATESNREGRQSSRDLLILYACLGHIDISKHSLIHFNITTYPSLICREDNYFELVKLWVIDRCNIWHTWLN